MQSQYTSLRGHNKWNSYIHIWTVVHDLNSGYNDEAIASHFYTKSRTNNEILLTLAISTISLTIPSVNTVYLISCNSMITTTKHGGIMYFPRMFGFHNEWIQGNKEFYLYIVVFTLLIWDGIIWEKDWR